MNKGDKAEKRIIKDSLFPISLFAIYLGVLLLMSGIHQGLVVLMNTLELNGFISYHLLDCCGGRAHSFYKEESERYL